MRILGDILKELRNEKQITLEELSNELNNTYDVSINKGMISKWEGNKSEPIFKFIKIFSEYYKVSVDYLLGLSEFRSIQEEVDNKNILSRKESNLITKFNRLNELGKSKVINYTDDLIDNPKYTEINIIEMPITKKKDIWEDEGKEHLMPQAAHAIEGNFTEEEYSNDNDLMKNDDFWK